MGTREARILTHLHAQAHTQAHTHVHTHAHMHAQAHTCTQGEHPTQTGRRHGHRSWCRGRSSLRPCQAQSASPGRWAPAEGRRLPDQCHRPGTQETRRASPGSFSESPRTGAASECAPLAGAAISSRLAHKAVSDIAAGPAAGPAQVWTSGCCWWTPGLCPVPPGAPGTGTGGATRGGTGRSHSHLCGRCWPRAAGFQGARWGRAPGFPAGWRSRRCGTASWTPASRPWSLRGARGSGSGPAHPALTASGSGAWLVGPKGALRSP